MREITTKRKKNRSLHYESENIRRAARRIGHRLSLAMSEEEDARLWKQYQTAIFHWQQLAVRSGYVDEHDKRLTERSYYKPVFDETYLALTRELAELYAQLRKAESGTRRRTITDQIRVKKQERWKTASFVCRDTGEAAVEIHV